MSPEMQVMLRPREAFAALAIESPRPWGWLRRPLLLALVIGCGAALLAEGALDPRLVLSAGLTWCFLPLLEISGLAVLWATAGKRIRFAQAIDLYFAGYAAWCLWIVGVGFCWATLTPARGLTTIFGCLGIGVLVAAWSAYVDYRFFRCVLKSNRIQALRALAMQRGIVWLSTLVVFGGGSLLSELHL